MYQTNRIKSQKNVKIKLRSNFKTDHIKQKFKIENNDNLNIKIQS
jgi:hypothetical protein